MAKFKKCLKRSPRRVESEQGVALIAALIFTMILTILGFSMLIVANTEIALTQKEMNRSSAFYLAEAGIGVLVANLSNGENGNIEETELGDGSYSVDIFPDADPPYAISTGTVRGLSKRIKVTVSFLAPPYEFGIYGANISGADWTLILRGTGNPIAQSGGEYGGKDKIYGDIYVDGDVAMYQESSINPAPAPNTYELEGDVNSGGSVSLYDSATVSGDITTDVEQQEPPDLVGMNYAANNTHNVSQIFADAHITQGYLPSGNELRNVFAINPTNMVAECASTSGNDYFLTPSTGFIGGTWKTAPTPLHAGSDRVYYVDGDVWVHSKSTYGFKMDGKATIVATGNIHLCDNILYNDSDSMLGLVALGKYNEDNELISGGNVYFGDPVYGTMYTFSAMMFAANNFLYNTDPITSTSAEPTSGFTVTGNLSALNNVSIERDWYTKVTGKKSEERRPARYNPATSQWVDTRTGTVLTSTQISSIKHYQMIINYDDRVRNRETQPKGLPRGVGYIFGGITSWEEMP